MAPDDAGQGGVTGVFFDVDGTLAASNLVDAYIDFRLSNRTLLRRGLWLLSFIPKLPYYALVDRFSRARFNRMFLGSYEGVLLEELRSWAEREGVQYWVSRLYADALLEIGRHRQQGHKIGLVTGGLLVTVRPLSSMLSVDAVAAAEAESLNGRLTGRLATGPPSGQTKAEETRRLADTMGVDLGKSYAYADSYSDRHFLECVGHPVAVNPDRRLRRLARARGWSIRMWRRRGSIGRLTIEETIKSG
ncbi:MAG: HAD-IB family hydrolase [Dehalococcoidia bacterium]